MDFDLIVIGAGSGGVRAARMLSSKGVKVACVESSALGGTCVNAGCVPKKLYSYASNITEELEDMKGYGWEHDGELHLDWPKLVKAKKKEILRLNGIYGGLFENSGVELIEGKASFVSDHEIKVNGKTYSAETFLIATGGWPFIPEFPGRELVISSNEIFNLPEFPQRLAVVGGGYIAVEFAGIFHGMGADVIQIYRRDLFLRGFDGDLRKHLKESMEKEGVELVFNTNVTAIEKTDDGLRLSLDNGQHLVADQVLYATGRVPNTTGLGLENTSTSLNATGAIEVDENSMTKAPNIYAIGDVTDRMNLTPVAIHEAMCFVDHYLKVESRSPDYSNIATAVFSHPNIGTVGLSEEEAKDKGYDVVIFRSVFTPLKNTLSGNKTKTLMKLVVDKASDLVLGVHMCGPDAGEIIQGFAIALKCAATKSQFDATIGIHPTSAEEFVTMREPAG